MFSYCIGSCLQLRCIRASCKSSQLSTVPGDHTPTLHPACSRKDVFVTPIRYPPWDDPSRRQAQLASDRPITQKVSLALFSQQGLSPNQRTASKFVCFQHCGNCGNSNAAQKQRQGCLQLRNPLSYEPQQPTYHEALIVRQPLSSRHAVFFELMVKPEVPMVLHT